MIFINLILLFGSILHIVFSSSPANLMGMQKYDPGEIHVVSVSTFPHDTEHIFRVEFSPKEDEYPMTSLLLFLIRENEKVYERGQFYPGVHDNEIYPFKGKYFKSVEAKIYENRSIILNIKFNPIAHYKLFEVRYGEYISRKMMEFSRENFIIYTSVKYSGLITLIVRTKLEVKTLTLDGRDDGVRVDEPGFCFCRGYGGIPEYRVRLDGLERFQMLDENEEYDQVENTVKRKVRFKLENHGDRFLCYTETSMRETYVKVFHHPTKVYLEPRYYSSMPNGSSVSCIAEDGYPTPEIRWKIVKGPPQPELYYNTYKQDLYLLPNAPIGSNWVFKCIAENIIPNTRVNSTSYIFRFTVVNSNSNVLVLAAASIGSLIALVALLVGVFLAVRPNSAAAARARVTANKNRRKKGATSSNSKVDENGGKELGFDPDTLIASTKSLCESTTGGGGGCTGSVSGNTTITTNTLINTPNNTIVPKSILVNNTNITKTTDAAALPNNNSDYDEAINNPAPAYDEIIVDTKKPIFPAQPQLPTPQINSINTTIVDNNNNNNNNNNCSNTKDTNGASYV